MSSWIRIQSLAWFALCAAVTGAPFARSGDVTWKPMGAGSGGAYLAAEVFQPNDPNFIMAGTDTAGPLKSTDGGVTWTNAMEGLLGLQPSQVTYVNDLAIDPTAAQTVYLGAFGLYRTTDFGTTWSLRAPISTYLTVAVDPSDPNWVFAGEWEGPTGQSHIVRSPDKWATAATSLPACSGATGPACTAALPTCPATSYKVAFAQGQAQSPDVRDIVVDPLNANELIAATDCGLYFSHNRGGTWVDGGPVANFDDYDHLVLHGSSRTLYAAMDGRFAKQIGFFSLADQDETNWNAALLVRKSTNWGQSWVSVAGSNGTDALGTTGDFETAPPPGQTFAGWTPFTDDPNETVTRVCGVGFNNSCAAKVTPPPAPNKGFGAGISQRVPVAANTVYLLSARSRIEGGGTATFPAFPLHSQVTFYDANSQLISWSSEAWDPTLNGGAGGVGSFSRVLSIGGGRQNQTFMRFQQPIRTPANAAFAEIHIEMYSGNGTMSPVTAAYYDEIHFERYEKLPAFAGWGAGGFGGETPVGFGSYGLIVVDPTDPNVVYVMGDNGTSFSEPSAGDYLGVWKTSDGGTTWRLSTRLYPTASPSSVTDPKTLRINGSKFGGFSLSIGLGSASHLHLLAGTGLNLYRTTDGGTTWSQTTYNNDPAHLKSPDHLGYYSSRGGTNNVFANFVVTDPNQPQRIFYGDADNFLQISYNRGASFVMEGAQIDGDNPSAATRGWVVPPSSLGSDSPTALIVDPADSNHLFVGAFTWPNISGTCPSCGGVVQGSYNAAGDFWAWTPLGTQSCLLRNGPVTLVRDRASGTILAGVMNQGLSRLSFGGSTWLSIGASCQSYSSSWFNPPGAAPPLTWSVTRLVQSPTSSRIFAGFGDPSFEATQDVSKWGLWMTDDLGNNWTNISFGAPFQPEPVLEVLPVNDNLVFVGTYGSRFGTLGGLYRGVQSGGTWTFTKVLNQQRVTGIARSPFNPNLMFAMSGQITGGPPANSNPGLYRSYDAGLTWSTTPVARNGLGNYTDVRLDPSLTDRTKLYASTRGAGVFEGTFQCDSPGTFDCSKMYFTLSAVTGSAPTLPGVTGSIAKTDIVSYDPSKAAFARFFQGTAAGVGIPSGAVIDAFAKLPGGDLLLSFNSGPTLPGLTGLTASDIVRFHPTTAGDYSAGTFSMYFDGSDVGLTTSNENVDSVYVDAAGDLYLSISGSGAAGTLSDINNRDIVKFHPTSLGTTTAGTYSYYFRGSTTGGGLNDASGENIDALFLAANAAGTPQVYLSTTGNFSVPTSITGTRIDVLRFTGTVGSAPSGTYDVFRVGTSIGLSTNWQLGAISFELP